MNAHGNGQGGTSLPNGPAGRRGRVGVGQGERGQGAGPPLDPGPYPPHAPLPTPDQHTTTTTKFTQHTWKNTDNYSDNDEHATRENPGDERTTNTKPVPTTKHQRTETTSTQLKRWVHNHATKQRSQGTTMATTAARHRTKNNKPAARNTPLNKPLSDSNGPGGSAAQPGH